MTYRGRECCADCDRTSSAGHRGVSRKVYGSGGPVHDRELTPSAPNLSNRVLHLFLISMMGLEGAEGVIDLLHPSKVTYAVKKNQTQFLHKPNEAVLSSDNGIQWEKSCFGIER